VLFTATLLVAWVVAGPAYARTLAQLARPVSALPAGELSSSALAPPMSLRHDEAPAPAAMARAPLCDLRCATTFAPAPQLQDEEVSLSLAADDDAPHPADTNRAQRRIGKHADADADVDAFVDHIYYTVDEQRGDGGLREQRLVFGHHRHHVELAEQDRRRHGQQAARRGVAACRSGIGLVEIGHDAARILEVAGPGLGHPDHARGARQQADPEPVFERRYRTRHRRRRHVQAPCRRRKTFHLGHGNKDVHQVVLVHPVFHLVEL